MQCPISYRILFCRLRVFVFYNMFPVADDLHSWGRHLKVLSCFLGSPHIFRSFRERFGEDCMPPFLHKACPVSNVPFRHIPSGFHSPIKSFWLANSFLHLLTAYHVSQECLGQPIHLQAVNHRESFPPSTRASSRGWISLPQIC